MDHIKISLKGPKQEKRMVNAIGVYMEVDRIIEIKK